MQTQSTNSEPRTVVSAIIEKIENNTRYIYLQTRWKPQSSPTYSGLIEIPAGGINGYENVFEALKREVKEETGLDVIRIVDGFIDKPQENRPGDESIIFQPFVCQQMLKSNGGLPWTGFVFRCQVSGSIQINKEEAKDPRWMSINDLKNLLSQSPELFFPLQYTTLLYYIKVAQTTA